jgi:hypothetical protein
MQSAKLRVVKEQIEMIDMSETTVPKSDQLNADDLIASPITIRVTKVAADMSNSEQPILIFFEGDKGKPFKPCKSMRRVLMNTWGIDGLKYAGRSMTLYRDPEVKWGGLAVGGIRISHMSDIEAPKTIALTASKANRKPFTVQPLAVKQAAAVDPITIYGREFQAALKLDTGVVEFWRDTADRRTALAIPADRLAKMQAAYDAWIAAHPAAVAHDAVTGEILDSVPDDVDSGRQPGDVF